MDEVDGQDPAHLTEAQRRNPDLLLRQVGVAVLVLLAVGLAPALLLL